MRLSICIPTIVERQHLVEKLYEKVISQVGENEDVEVLVASDNKEISIGAKRQHFLLAAQGEYVVMIDDDDDISDDYVSEILKAIENGPDCVGFQIKCTGTEGKTADMSNKYSDWADSQNGFDYVRTPYQKTPMRTILALAIGYKDMRYGEDYDFSKRLKQSGLITSEVYIPKTLYHYRFKYEDPKTKYGLTKDGRKY